jgi:ribose 5-phosphate isomerase A
VPGVLLQLKEIGGEARVRERDGQSFVSDNGNSILDWNHGIIDDPAKLEKQLKLITGVVDSGIFASVADCVIVAGSQGIRKLTL